MGNQQVQHQNVTLDAGALVTQTVVSQSLNIDAGRISGVRIKKWMASFNHRGFANGEGPVMFGFSTDLSAAEIAEALVADPQGTGDAPATERANRKVFPIGITPSFLSSEIEYQREIHWPWKEMKEGTGLQFWLFNTGAATLTTGGSVTVVNSWVTEWFD